MKKIYLLFLIAAFGCEKETIEVVNYPAVLVAREYHVLTDVKLFTKTGQITDKAIISSYLKKDTQGYFYKNKDSHVPINKPDTVIYQSKDTVLFSSPGDWGIRVPKQVGDYIHFSMTDTLAGFKSLMEEGPLVKIIRQIGLFKPYYEDIGPSNYGYQRVFSAFVAKGNPRRLEFPELTYLVTRRWDNTYNSVSMKNYNNVLDPDVVNLLRDGDTLAIQEAKIVYIQTDK